MSCDEYFTIKNSVFHTGNFHDIRKGQCVALKISLTCLRKLSEHGASGLYVTGS